jgi:hypothetical protein
MRLVYLADDDSYYGEHTRVPRVTFETAVARFVAGGSAEQAARTLLLEETSWFAPHTGTVLLSDRGAGATR